VKLSVKLRGQRVELGEVQRHLRATMTDATDVRAYVAALSDVDSGPVLVAFCVVDGAKCFKDRFFVPGDSSMLHRFGKHRSTLRDVLPKHMIPSFVISLARVPLTSNGKTNHRALRSEESRRLRSEPFAYDTDTEATTANSRANLVAEDDGFCFEGRANFRWH
jgi:hypothetical protein